MNKKLRIFDLSGFWGFNAAYFLFDVEENSLLEKDKYSVYVSLKLTRIAKICYIT